MKRFLLAALALACAFVAPVGAQGGTIGGATGTTFPLKGADGSSAAPTYSWTNATNSGWYRAATNDFRFAINGTDRMQALVTQIVFTPTKQITVPSGTAAEPGYAFNVGNNLGLYRFGADSIGIATGGVHSLVISDGANPIITGGAGSMTFVAGTGVSRSILFRATDNSSNQTTTFRVQGGATVQTQTTAGTAATPGIAFINDGNTGVWNQGADTLGIATAGAHSLSVTGGATTTLVGGAGNMTIQAGTGNSRTMTLQGTDAGGVARNALVVIDSQVQAMGGRIGKPAYSFVNDTDVGLAAPGTDTLSFVSGGQAAIKIVTAGVNSRLIGRGGLIIHSNGSAVTVDGGGTGGGATGWAFGNTSFVSQGGRSHDIAAANATLAVVYSDTISSGDVDTLLLKANNTLFARGVHDTLIVANKAKAPTLTAAAGTPNSVCMNATSKEIVENAATSCVVSSRRFKTNILPLTDVVAQRITTQLKPSVFKYRVGGRNAIGLIAEEADSVDSRLATRDGQGRINSVNYEQVTIVLLKQVQTLTAKLDRMCRAGVREAC